MAVRLFNHRRNVEFHEKYALRNGGQTVLIEVVGAAIIRGDTLFCAQRGPASKTLVGKWEFPGGKIEPGETPQQALAREIREEFNSEVLVGDHIATSVYDYPFGQVRLSTYYCTLQSGTLTLTEHQAGIWQPIANLNDLDWSPADQSAVSTIISSNETT